MAVLVTTDEENVLLEIGKESATIGRAEHNALCLKASKVSLVHAKIVPSKQGCVLIDLRSTNGTYVNGSAIRRKLLRHGDRIRFGHYEAIFLDQDETPTVVTRPDSTDEYEEEDGREEYQYEREKEERYEEAEEEEEYEEEIEEREEWEKEEGREEEEITIEIEPDFEEEYDLDVLYRRRLRHGNARRRIRRAIFFSLFLLLSLFLHYEGRHVLDYIGLGGAEAYQRKRVEIETNFVLVIEEKPVPRERRDLLELFPEEMQMPADERAAEELPKIAADVPPLHLGDLSAVTELEIAGFVPVREFRPAQSFTTADAAGAVALTTSERARTFSDQLDDFAMEMINVLVEEPLHVVLIFDRSYSLEDDRDYMQKRLDRIIELLNLNLKPTERLRLKWSVVGFGDLARVYLSKTDDVDQVRKAIAKIANDKSGVENFLAALSYCMRMLEHKKEKTFFVAVTDETGDDTENEDLVSETLKGLLKNNVTLFVFGREANFSCPIVQDIGIDRATGNTFQGDVHAGPESAYSEFLEPDELFNPFPDLPSGFGAYVQSRLAAATGGRYYMLGGGKSNYDSARLAEYAPELCSRQEYLKRREKSRTRRTIAAVLEEWPKQRPDAGARSDSIKEEIKAHLDRAEKCDALCKKATQELEDAEKSAEKEKYQPRRWQANRDLVLAQLYRFRFLLADYILKLRTFGNTTSYSKDGQPLIGFRVATQPGRPEKMDKSLQEKAEQANRFLVQVMERHPKTPWDAMARLLRDNFYTFRITPSYRPARREGEEGPKPPQPPPPPEPPKL